MSTTSWIRWLDETDTAKTTDAADRPGEEHTLPAELGGKGANLYRLLRLGFPVPPGFVITTAGYRKFLAANDIESRVEASDPATFHKRITQAPMPDEMRAAILSAYQRLGAGPVAVRSSGTAEDLAAASFAGQHDTLLNVSGQEALLSAVRLCWASLWTPRAVAYRRQHGWDDLTAESLVDESGDKSHRAPGYPLPLALAVVVQVMVPAEAAGVAFTANPVTGDRSETTISAVRGLGERVVSGEGIADEWVVRGEADVTKVGAGERSDAVVSRRGGEGALTEEQALAVAKLAGQIERCFGAPQDVEWAIVAGGRLSILQARPMTALPAPGGATEAVEAVEVVEPVTWVSPAKGGWMRNFRLGEWLPEPVTPLCENWLLARVEAGEVAAEERDFGVRPRPPYHVLVNGWYFSSPIGGGVPLRGVATALVRHPRSIAALALSTSRPQVADRLFIARIARRWREELLPRYQQLVASWEARVETARSIDLIDAVDAIADMVGEYLWDLSVVGGHAWKAEHALARFCRHYLPDQAARSHQELLLGLPLDLPASYPAVPPHAVLSLDWVRPTLGEAEVAPSVAHDLLERRMRMAEDRRAAEVSCLAALVSQPRRRRQFDLLLALAQRYAMLREEQAYWFTLGWPLLRRAVLRLGDELDRRGALARAEDVFFLTRAELEVGLGAVHQAGALGQDDQYKWKPSMDDLRLAVVTRRQLWERQRRLSPPLVLGNPLGARIIVRATDAMRASSGAPTTGGRRFVLTGMPASPGRAEGAVRIVRGPEDFVRFRPGEVLVAQVTAPAWTPLFGRAAAVVTDGGSLAAHASLVAREFGIPAVVGVGDATERLHDGQHITVDGNAGIVMVPL